jgi:hypothetical protein
MTHSSGPYVHKPAKTGSFVRGDHKILIMGLKGPESKTEKGTDPPPRPSLPQILCDVFPLIFELPSHHPVCGGVGWM